MRDLRLDIVGTTDANGAATITLKLPSTGEWHDMKIAASTTGPAEWAILISGTPVTYGRGRRVTLGPELVRDGETVSISITGAPPLASVTGAATGKSGHADEIVAAYTPSPNTITVDAASPTLLLGTVVATNGGTVTTNFPLPPGAQAVGFNWDETGANVAPSLVRLTGLPTSTQYLQVAPSALGLAAGGMEVAAIASGVDTSLRVSVTAPAAQQSTVYIMAWLTNVQTWARVVDGTTLPVTPISKPYDAVADSGEPASGAAAAATVAAVAGKQHVCALIRAEIVGSAAAPAGTVVRFRLRDGASGVGAILQSWTMGVQAVAGQQNVVELSGLAIAGTVGNAMSCDFSAGIANAFESCGLGVYQQ